ncbi:hypothetical protein GKE82_01715 [Conexibacter sp. W3-3-2]|uniref:hypothetical protein n=1 Tax=Conexibacter sp. W3-3-2 TaxID=2675227 RepID=UPI0012B82E16|nr:hypothetical protein [Conexibacter sp. W3-3-2]MTD43054.1 hypothetical protein [Conexibacter sp. W3-3-2]
MLAALTLAACGGDDGPSGPTVSDDRTIDVALGYGPVVPLRARLVGPLDGNAWVFTRPGAGRPTGPPVVFVHDWGATDPTTHGPWIAHLVAAGRTVVFPLYQTGQGDRPSRALPQAATGIRNALELLGVSPRRAFYLGYGAGGALAADIAASAGPLTLPRAAGVVAAYPSRTVRPLLTDEGSVRLPAPAGRRLAPGTPLLALAGADDSPETRTVARTLVRAAGPTGRLRVITDPRISEHTGPIQTDPVARRTFWATVDRLIDSEDDA